MNVHISYKVHKTPEIEKEINHIISKLQKRLQVFRPDLVHLKGIIEENTHGRCEVSLNLRLPSGQMAAQNAAPTDAAAIKAAFEDLLHQVTRHKELLRTSHKWRRQRANRSEPQIPFEETLAAVHPLTVSPDDVRSWVNANLARLEKFVERELYFREAADQLPPDWLTREEVVDEVIARALDDDGTAKPELLALEPWLYRLAVTVLSDMAAASQDDGSIHLEDYAGKHRVDGTDEPALQFHQPDETFTGETVIADPRLATPEQIAYSDEMISLMQAALHGASPADREAFILYSLEGFTVAEISAITDRTSEAVDTSIRAAREHLRRSPPMRSQAAVRPLRRTGTA